MSRGAQTPRTKNGGELQAIQPGKAINTGEADAKSTVQTTAEIVGTQGCYIFCDSLVHVRFDRHGAAVDASYPPIDARGGTVLACDAMDKVSFVLKDGEAQAPIWICPLES